MHRSSRCTSTCCRPCGTARTESGRWPYSSCDRRPLRVEQQGVHSGDGKGGLRRSSEATTPNGFTIGIVDDVTHTSLTYDPSFTTDNARVRAVFYGLGADGTVGANKNTAKIVGKNTDLLVQAYFVYDSKKSGSMTISHLRFDPEPIDSTYLIDRATFVGVHQWSFLERIDVLGVAAPGATVLINSPYPADQVWDRLPCRGCNRRFSTGACACTRSTPQGRQRPLAWPVGSTP